MIERCSGAWFGSNYPSAGADCSDGFVMPSLDPPARRARVPGRVRLRGHFCACHHGRAEAARDHRHDPAGQARQAALTPGMMARAASSSDTRLRGSVPRHAGGRARRRRQYARRLPARSRRFRRLPGRRAARAWRPPTAMTCAPIWPISSQRGFWRRSVARRLSAIRQLYRFLYAEGHRSDDPAAVLEGPEARTDACRKSSRSPKWITLLAAARAAVSAGSMSPPERLRAARLTCLLEVALRHRPARLRTGDAAGVRGAPQRAHAHRARQRRPGAHGAAQRGGEARHGRLPRTARPRPGAADRNGCSRRSARAGHLTPPAFRPRSQGARGRHRPARRAR